MLDSPALIAFAVVVIPLAAYVVLLTRKTRFEYLDTILSLPGEVFLFEEQVRRCRVRMLRSGREELYFACTLRLTDRRLILAQKVLFKPRYLVRRVVFLGDAVDPEQGELKGHQNYRLLSDSVREEGGKVLFEAEPELDNPGVSRIRVTIPTSRVAEYWKALKTAHRA